MRYRTLLSTILLLPAAALAQNNLVITTLAGSDFVFRGDGRPALEAQLSQIYDVAVDSRNNVLVADRSSQQIVRIAPDGILTVVAGNGIDGYSGDGGPATLASLSYPTAVTTDRAGNIYIADNGNRRIRKVTPDGIISTIAGNGVRGSSGDGGSALSASVDSLQGVAVDSAGSVYFSDSALHRVRRMTPDGIVRNFAGNGQRAFAGDGGPAAQASLNQPARIAFDAAGNLYIADTRNHRVRRVAPDGVIRTFAGRGDAVSDGDGGPATNAGIVGPNSVFPAANGSVYIAEFFAKVRVVSPDGTIRTFAGVADTGFGGDGGPALQASLGVLLGIAGDSAGNVFIADSINLRVRRVDPQGVIRTFAGSGQYSYSGDGGPAVTATFSLPYGIATDLNGNTYISDNQNHRIRRVDRNGVISTVAGTGESGFSGDNGPAVQARLNSPLGLATDLQGNLYIADLLNNRVRRVSPDGVITTVAGGAPLGPPPPDSLPASQLRLNPSSVAVDLTGNLYVMDQPVCVVYKISAGVASRYAGQYLRCGSAGDGGPARSATIAPSGDYSAGIALDILGNLYIAEPNPATPDGGGRVRRVAPDGTISAFAGNGTFGFPQDAGVAVQQGFLTPGAVTSDLDGNIYIADLGSIYGVVTSGTFTGRIIRIAGSALASELGDGGRALDAYALGINGLAFDIAGNLNFTDAGNSRVRQVLIQPPTLSAAPARVEFRASSGGAPPPVQNIAVTSSIPGVGFAAAVSTLDGAAWLKAAPAAGTAPRLIEVSVDPSALAAGTYTGRITISSPLALPATRSIDVSFVVDPGAPPKLQVDKPSLSYSFPRAGEPRTQVLTITDAGGGLLDFSAAAVINGEGNWLTLSAQSGQARPASPQTLSVTADPAGLRAGTYTARITVTGAGDTQVIPVTVTVSDNDQAILLSQAGLSFLAVSGGGVTPPRAFEVLNIGRGAVNWRVTTSTLGGGPQWLSVTPAAGATDASSSSVPSVQVRVNQAGLAPGVYYGLVRVEAPQAANSPQVVTVFFEVLPAGSDPGPIVEPGELVFTTAAGQSPGAQEVFVYNLAAAPKTYRSTAVAAAGTLVSRPTDAVLDVSRPNRLLLQPFVDTLSPGAYNATANLQFSDGRVRTVRIQIIVTAGAPGKGAGRSADGCEPKRLLPAITSLSPSTPITAGWPVPINVDVRDDCGNPLESGTVVVNFFNGDPSLPLQSLKGGRWAGTWPSRGGAAATETVLKVDAANPAAQISGTESVVIGIRAKLDPPDFEARGVGSAAGFQSFVPLAPGGIMTIFGDRLAEATEQASALPLPVQLGSARVFIGGREAPLLFASPGQINAIIPIETTANTRQQVLVQRANTVSKPVGVDVAQAQPAVFPGGAAPQGSVFWVREAGGTPVLAAPASPARAGDVIILYTAGLGPTKPAVAAGDAAPASPLAQLNGEIRLTVGGIDAPIFFAGLAPGFTGVYQINAVVPAGVQQGDAVPVVIQTAGQTSPAVSIAVR